MTVDESTPKPSPLQAVSINGIEFKPREGIRYIHNYLTIADEILLCPMEHRVEKERQTYRELVKHDLWFILQFIVQAGDCNKKFIVDSCREVQYGPKTNTLDVWAREHYKSTILTIAETIQDLCNNPDTTICILSYARHAAKVFLIQLKQILEQSEFLKWLFPEIFYADPATQAFKWSEDIGLWVNRKSMAREPSIAAYGLIDGQPTGRHFSKLVYDDVVTDEVARSPEMIEKVKRAFDMSANCGTDGGRRRVIGTFYNHDDPLTYIQGLKDPATSEDIFTTRLKPATVDGTANGAPVLLSERKLVELSSGDRYIFNCQQLCNPTPVSDMSLNPKFLIEVEPHEIPKRMFKFMTVDPAGMQSQTKRRGDAWAVLVAGIVPYRDDLGASDLYILDAIIEPMNEAEALENIPKIYKRNGRIQQVGVEQIGMSSMEVHVRNALQGHGINLSVDLGTLKLLKPAGRPKQTRIERNLSWPLQNGKIHISAAIPNAYKERLRLEMEKFPYWHDDALDALSYFYDILRDYTFGPFPQEEISDKPKRHKYESSYHKHRGTDLGWMEV